MSTLTPTGHGRRGLLPVIVAVVAALAIGVAAGWWFTGREKDAASPEPSSSTTCSTHASTSKSGSPKPVVLPDPRTIKVNVYNATKHRGLARSTSVELAARGFGIGSVANDPLNKLIVGTAEVRYGSKGVAPTWKGIWGKTEKFVKLDGVEHVYDAAKIVERFNDLRAFDSIRFAQKACSNLAILDLARRNGVLVDARCRTSLPDVFAAGDVTNHLHPIFGRLRVEHWNNGYQQGQAAARSLLGREQPYDYIHSFWSDQYEHLIEYVGFAARWDRLVFRGRPESRKFLGFYLEGGIVRAAVGLNRGGDPEDPKVEGELKAAVKLIRNRTAVDPAKLADEAVDLHGLVVAGAR
jgi:hypothetical protein